jgi:phage FluMu gp28-like protein
VSIYDAIKQGCEIDLDLLKKNIDEEGFQENYECAFLDESTAYFTYDLLKSCIAEIDKSQEGKKYIGLDVGRTNDATAITVLNQNKDGLLTLIDFKEIKNTRFSDQRPLIQEMIDKYNPVSVNADKGSVGYQLVEDLEGDNKCVKGISMNNQMKMEAFTKMKKSFEEKSLLIPSDIDLLNQIHSVKREFGSGVIRFSADRTAKGHSDMAFSLALAIYATTGKKSSPKITLITGR